MVSAILSAHLATRCSGSAWCLRRVMSSSPSLLRQTSSHASAWSSQVLASAAVTPIMSGMSASPVRRSQRTWTPPAARAACLAARLPRLSDESTHAALVCTFSWELRSIATSASNPAGAGKKARHGSSYTMLRSSVVTFFAISRLSLNSRRMEMRASMTPLLQSASLDSGAPLMRLMSAATVAWSVAAERFSRPSSSTLTIASTHPMLRSVSRGLSARPRNHTSEADASSRRRSDSSFRSGSSFGMRPAWTKRARIAPSCLGAAQRASSSAAPRRASREVSPSCATAAATAASSTPSVRGVATRSAAACFFASSVSDASPCRFRTDSSSSSISSSSVAASSGETPPLAFRSRRLSTLASARAVAYATCAWSAIALATWRR
mmetsp:Transcript_14163/g.46522  ORF Transcript_14163/g.46522 Transcript_14163/m.46522 type:complete len:380 (-) Transcript_14163:928-2067(-)